MLSGGAVKKNWVEGMAKKRARPNAGGVRSVNYASSPLLASRTPPWRSKFFVAMVMLGFLVLIGRALGGKVKAV